MSIVTRTGDRGTTGLMYNRRVSKCHPRVEAYGCVDELTSALGLARASLVETGLQEKITLVQKDLITLMGELATDAADLPRYVQDGFPRVTADQTAKLDALAREFEAGLRAFSGWILPGGTPAAAALDVARSVCRRAERRACALEESDLLKNPEIIIYLNRLADVLWLMARRAENDPPPQG